MGIQRYIFFSIHNAERHPEVPLMLIKSCTEKFLEGSDLDYTIFRLCGFMQAIIGNYAVPILEDRQVWGTSDQTQTAYLDSQVRAMGLSFSHKLCVGASHRGKCQSTAEIHAAHLHQDIMPLIKDVFTTADESPSSEIYPKMQSNF